MSYLKHITVILIAVIIGILGFYNKVSSEAVVGIYSAIVVYVLKNGNEKYQELKTKNGGVKNGGAPSIPGN